MASGYGRGYSGSRDERKGKGSGSKKSKNKSDRSSQGYYKGAQIQNVKAARVYVFGDDDVAEEDENVEFEMPEMRSRKGTSHLWQEKDDQPEYFEKEIDEGETLQAIALKYACTVSDLKRLNNLIQDQEFFGLRVLKVPMKKYGVLSEQYGNNSKDSTSLQHSKHTNGAAFSPDSDYDMQTNYYDESDSQHDFSDPDTQAKIMRTLSIRENISSQGKEAEKFLLKMDADLSKFKQSSRSERESLSEVISVLTNKSIHPLQTSRPNNKVNGATCGISWKSIICIAVSIAVLMPLIYLFYIEYIYKREAKDEHLNDTSP